MTKYIGFQYPGGKLSKVKILLKFVPKHKLYVEPFGGSGALLLNKKPSQIEIYNDIDQELSNLFFVLKFKYDEFMKASEWLLHSKKFYDYYTQVDANDLSDVERAVRYFFLLHSSFGGIIGNGYTPSFSRSLSVQYNNKLKSLHLIRDRLRRVQITNVDSITLLNKLLKRDSDLLNKTFIYLDPPYLSTTRANVNVYKYDNKNTEFHQKLLDIILKLNKMGVKILLSGYDNDLYNNSLIGFNKYSFNSYVSMKYNNGTNRLTRNEALWYNYDMDVSQNEK